MKKKKYKKPPEMSEPDLSPAQLAADSHYSLAYHLAPHEQRILIVKTVRELLEKSPNGRVAKKEINLIIRQITGKIIENAEDQCNEG